MQKRIKSEHERAARDVCNSTEYYRQFGHELIRYYVQSVITMEIVINQNFSTELLNDRLENKSLYTRAHCRTRLIQPSYTITIRMDNLLK